MGDQPGKVSFDLLWKLAESERLRRELQLQEFADALERTGTKKRIELERRAFERMKSLVNLFRTHERDFLEVIQRRRPAGTRDAATTIKPGT